MLGVWFYAVKAIWSWFPDIVAVLIQSAPFKQKHLKKTRKNKCELNVIIFHWKIKNKNLSIERFWSLYFILVFDKMYTFSLITLCTLQFLPCSRFSLQLYCTLKNQIKHSSFMKSFSPLLLRLLPIIWFFFGKFSP